MKLKVGRRAPSVKECWQPLIAGKDEKTNFHHLLPPTPPAKYTVVSTP